MTVDIIIGKKQTCAPLFPCMMEGVCAGRDCRECVHSVQQEQRSDAPIIETATAQGMKKGGFNFTTMSTGWYFRWLRETGLVEQYPWLNIPTNDDMSFPIPDTMPGFLHRLAVDIEIGKVVTTYPADDARITCWFAWWTAAALKSYGLQAAICFH